MLRRIFILLTVTLFFSCGKDVVEVIDTTIPHEPQEIFEVNVVGYSTDSEHNFLENVKLTINGSEINTDSTSFFIENKILVGKEGSVVGAEKMGYLPVFKRVYHHRSLEDVVTNITMVEAPDPKVINSLGGDIIADDGTVLIFDQDAISESSDITFYASFDMTAQVDFDPFIMANDEVKILDNQAIFYIGSPVDINQDAVVTIRINSDKITDLANIGLYKYNESNLTWELMNSNLQDSNGIIQLSLSSLGWWSLGVELETRYATVKFNQESESSSEIYPISGSEVIFVKSAGHTSNEHLFTNEEGKISKYFPVGSYQYTVTLNDEYPDVVFDLDFTNENRTTIVKLDDQITHQVIAEVYDCDLDKQGGYVAIISGNRYVIKRINNGRVDCFTKKDNENIEFRFYGLDADLLLTRGVATENIETSPMQFVACSQGMVVEDSFSILQNFDRCKVRVKTIESFIVGEDSDDNQFFIAFIGHEAGEYDGLVYADEIPSFSVGNIENDVKIEIMIYDKISSTIAGFVDGKYINGEEYKVTFIGNVEL